MYLRQILLFNCCVLEVLGMLFMYSEDQQSIYSIFDPQLVDEKDRASSHRKLETIPFRPFQKPAQSPIAARLVYEASIRRQNKPLLSQNP